MALNTRKWTAANLELYSETIMDVGRFGVSTRLGLRFPVWHAFHAGIEAEWPEQTFWYRVWWASERVRRPYAWWRYNAEYGHNGALGYLVDEHISIELHYDSRYEDKLGLRGIFQL